MLKISNDVNVMGKIFIKKTIIKVVVKDSIRMDFTRKQNEFFIRIDNLINLILIFTFLFSFMVIELG